MANAPVAENKLSLSQLIHELDSIGSADCPDSELNLEALKSHLERLEIEPGALAPFQNFSDEGYQRNLVYRTGSFEILLLCFEPGQRTPIHDHAGSACGVKVLEGKATETTFRVIGDGYLSPSLTRQLLAPGVVGSVDMDIHQLANFQADERLMTLHIYSPPLGKVGNYQLEDNNRVCVQAESRAV